MASPETPEAMELESPEDIRREIDQKLEEDGMSHDCTDEDKLLLVWKLYQHTEATLQTAIENEEKLKLAQTAEMQEVENYVEHIRHLSDEREALIQELETENDQLKGDITQLKHDQNAEAVLNETAEMLIQQGLDDIAMVSTSEQIAFLLVERARLLDELEAEQSRTISPMEAITDGEVSEDILKLTLEKERNEHEEELIQARDSIRSLKTNYEEEINGLMDENNKLEDDLVQTKEKLVDIEKENTVLKDEIQQFKSDSDSRASTPRVGRPPSPARMPNDVALRNIIQEKTKLEGELLTLKSHIRNLESTNEENSQKIKNVEEELAKTQSLHQQLQMKNRSLKSEIEEAEQQLDEAESNVDEMSAEKDKMKESLNSTENEMKTLRAELQASSSLKEIVDILSSEKNQLTEELGTLKKEFDEVCTEKEELTEEKLMMSKSEIELTNQLHSLKFELGSKADTGEFQKQSDQLLQTLDLLDSATTELESLRSNTDTLTKENKELLNRLEMAQEELKNLKQEGQEVAKQDPNVIILAHVKDQNQKLSKEVNTLSTDLEHSQKVEDDLIQKLDNLQQQHDEANDRYNKEVEDLKSKLQLTFSELGKSKTLLEEQYGQNSELQDQLQVLERTLNETCQTKRAIETKASEAGQLAQQINQLENQLLEKGTFEQMFEEKRDEISLLEKELDELEGLKFELEDTREQLEKERNVRFKMESTIHELEQIMEDQKIDNENMQQSLNNKLKTYENRVKALQDDLFAAQDEIQTMQETHEKELLKVKATSIDLQERMQAEKGRSLQAEVNSANQRIDAQKNENLERQLETLKIRLAESNNILELTTRDKSAKEHEIKVLNESVKQNEIDGRTVNTLKKELTTAQRELEHLHLSTKYSEDERQRHMDKIHSLEDFSKQLELDNREIASKLSESVSKMQTMEDQLKRDKQRNSDKQYQSSVHVTQVEKDLEGSTKQNRQLRDELQKKQTYVMRLEADAIGNAAKYESTIARLESELGDMKNYHKKEVESTQDRLDAANRELGHLREQLREKEQEASTNLQEVSRSKGATDRLEAQLQTEIKIRTDMENRNTALDQEVSKVWTQVRTLMEKNASLESSKRSLEDELERKRSTTRQSETSFAHSTASQEVAMKSLSSRADLAEKRIPVGKGGNSVWSCIPIIHAEKLQQDFSDVSFKLRSVEHQLAQADDLKHTLMDKKEQISQLRNQLEAEKLQRTLLDQTVSELKHQVSLLKQRESKVSEQNRELQHTILDLESKMEDMADRNQTSLEMDSNAYLGNSWDSKQQHLTDVGKRSLMDQITRLQKEVKDLQYELLTVNERREIQERKYEDRKMKTKHKLMRASSVSPGDLIRVCMKEFYAKERNRMTEQMTRMDEDLSLTRSTLRKELDWKEKIDKNYQHLLHEKRDLLSRLADQDETLREKGRSVSTLQVRSKYLEDENSRLLDRIELINQQKLGIDKVLKDFKLGKDRELTRSLVLSPADSHHPHSLTGGTSGLGNSVDSSWANDYRDNITPFRTQTSNVDTYLNRNYSGGTVDLYRAETGSEDSYSHEFDA
ncbi:early endosome antigen 1-like isoform X3 [Mizuhopecten yessoensis]|uniref:early endosome antigen 1-like isoform X3 n=1 Tax=Mizuhopecten yessoensis TaxID=6573 RepID=UPI000B458B97|nr:early endosome antigen 1-like isoform X3 [Mizuhopecten yessoensis]